MIYGINLERMINMKSSGVRLFNTPVGARILAAFLTAASDMILWEGR
jgi:hypothetical protein